MLVYLLTSRRHTIQRTCLQGPKSERGRGRESERDRARACVHAGPCGGRIGEWPCTRRALSWRREKILTTLFHRRPPLCCLGWDRSGWPQGWCVIASPGCLVCIGNAAPEDTGRGRGTLRLLGMGCVGSSSQPSWHLGCLVNARRDMGPSQVTSPPRPHRPRGSPIPSPSSVSVVPSF